MYRIVIVLLILSANLFPQDFLKLFRSEIPENILLDPVISKSLDLNLKRNVLLSPELIYATIKYYQQYNGEKFDTKLFEELKKEERFWILKRNDWAQSTIEKIKLTEDHNIISNTIGPLEDLIIEVKNPEKNTVINSNNSETQLRDYYIVKYYNSKPEMRFDDTQNYTAIRKQIETSKLQYFIDVMANPDLLISPTEIVDNVIDNWYLLLDNQEINSTNILTACLDDILLDKSRKKYSIFIGGVFVNNTVNLDEKLNFPGIDYSVNINKTGSLPQYSFGIGYKIYFDKKSYFLSFVDLQLFYSMGYKEISEEYPVAYTNKEVTSTYTIDETLRNFNDDYKISNLNSIGLKFSIPFYEMGVLSLELAASLNYNSFLYKPDMHFTYSKYKTNVGPPVTRETLALGAETIQEEKTINYFSVIPMLDANIIIESRFGLRLSASYNFAAMSVFYATPLFY